MVLRQPYPAAQPAPAEPLRVAFHTLGCRLNQVDTEGLKLALQEGFGIREVAWASPADLYILNSCTVTGKADQECRRLARQAKRRHPRAKIVVTGCYAQTQPQELASLPEIDGVIGNASKHDVQTWLPTVMGQGGLCLQVEDFARPAGFHAPRIASFSGRSRVFVKIQDGCDRRCSYCLIWQARGPSRSRPVAAVTDQLRVLGENRFCECILTGVHLGLYGSDLEPASSLTGLLDGCLRSFPEMRLRIGSIHPDELTPALLDLFATRPRLRPHLHISLQSGSSAVLRRMGRPYDRHQARRALAAAVQVRSDLGLGADVIVGFPGESEADFQETCDLVEEFPFTYLHVFRFSPRPGTVAAAMSDQIQPEVITRRSARLRALARGKQAAFQRGLVGTVREAVIESRSGQAGHWLATTDNYATVHVDGEPAPGSLVEVALREYRNGRLFGRIGRPLAGPAESGPRREV